MLLTQYFLDCLKLGNLIMVKIDVEKPVKNFLLNCSIVVLFGARVVFNSGSTKRNQKISKVNRP